MQKVSVGITSAVGYALTLTGFGAAIVAYLTGDHSADNINVIVSGAIATLAYVVTSLGRYLQAQALIKNPPRQTGGAIADTMPPAGMTFPTSSPNVVNIGGTLASTDEPDELEPADELDPRADGVPITDRPPADVGDAGDPALTVPPAKAARA